MSRAGGAALAFASLVAASPRARAIRFLTYVCRPGGTYLLDRCGPGEQAVSPHHSGMAVLALVRAGHLDPAASIVDWLRARQPAPGKLMLAYNGRTGAPLDAEQAEAEDFASVLLAGAELAGTGAAVDHSWLARLAGRPWHVTGS